MSEIIKFIKCDYCSKSIEYGAKICPYCQASISYSKGKISLWDSLILPWLISILVYFAMFIWIGIFTWSHYKAMVLGSLLHWSYYFWDKKPNDKVSMSK